MANIIQYFRTVIAVYRYNGDKVEKDMTDCKKTNAQKIRLILTHFVHTTVKHYERQDNQTNYFRARNQ